MFVIQEVEHILLFYSLEFTLDKSVCLMPKMLCKILVTGEYNDLLLIYLPIDSFYFFILNFLSLHENGENELVTPIQMSERNGDDQF